MVYCDKYVVVENEEEFDNIKHLIGEHNHKSVDVNHIYVEKEDITSYPVILEREMDIDGCNLVLADWTISNVSMDKLKKSLEKKAQRYLNQYNTIMSQLKSL